MEPPTYNHHLDMSRFSDLRQLRGMASCPPYKIRIACNCFKFIYVVYIYISIYILVYIYIYIYI
jgi:hypothetical protein